MRPFLIGTAIALVTVAGCAGAEPETDEEPLDHESSLLSGRGDGEGKSVHTSGTIDRTNPFFLSLGVNDRTCESCHDERAAWTMSGSLARRLFWQTGGQHPFFRPHDGANRPDADVSTFAARVSAYSMGLTRAVTRFTRTIPATAEFTVEAVDDPYGFSTPAAFSSFRRPIPIANIAKEVAITWTGTPSDMLPRLATIMNGATRGHAQRTTDIPVEQQVAGAQFMFGLTFAQQIDANAGPLDARGARGGAVNLAAEPFYIGRNALGGDTQTGAPFDPQAFRLYGAWKNLHRGSVDRARARIARGEEMFNRLEFDIRGVAGLNDALGQPVVRGRCTTCHNAPNVGGHSEFRLMDTGIADASRRTPDMPLVTVRNKTTGEVRKTMDLGRATGSGLWADIGKFKAPTLRGLAAREPYFHDGSAQSLRDVLKFYKRRFNVDFCGNEDDLIAFLETL